MPIKFTLNYGFYTSFIVSRSWGHLATKLMKHLLIQYFSELCWLNPQRAVNIRAAAQVSQSQPAHKEKSNGAHETNHFTA